MILGYNPVWQALLGTLLTWGLTAAGSALVFIFSSGQRRILDGSLGFAAGVFSYGIVFAIIVYHHIGKKEPKIQFWKRFLNLILKRILKFFS